MTSAISTHDSGKQAEALAREHLIHLGLTLMCANYRLEQSQEEIDLIMQEGSILVFVEVRSRRHCRHGHPLNTITPQKQQKIIKAATHYLLKNRLYDKVACRFDVISILPNGETWQIEWVKDAFRANG